jgi:hypothetical protein
MRFPGLSEDGNPNAAAGRCEEALHAASHEAPVAPRRIGACPGVAFDVSEGYGSYVTPYFARLETNALR